MSEQGRQLDFLSGYRPCSDIFSKKKACSIQIKALSLYPIIRALWLTIVIKTLPLCYKK